MVENYAEWMKFIREEAAQTEVDVINVETSQGLVRVSCSR